jgi:hypothetical protein
LTIIDQAIVPDSDVTSYLIARIHTFLALATIVNLLVYAVAGIAPRALPAPEVSERPFVRPPAESDRTTADRVVRLMGLSLAAPVHDFNISHDFAGRLTLDFYHANGRHKVTVLSDRLHIETGRAGLGKYLSTMHVTTAAFHSADRRMQLWAWYNEFAMWALIVMLATGGWLAVTRRWRPGIIRRTHWLTAIVALPVLTIFAVSAIQLTHRSWWAAGPFSRMLASLHRGRSGGLPPVATALLPFLAATGMVLWYRGRDRGPGAVLLAVGALVSGGLLVWIRGG